MNNQQKLLSLAQNAASHSYSPYSHFAVGAALLATDGKFYSGCNVENVSFPVGTCAEESAIAAMITGGSQQIAEILIFADSDTLISPCGACRQRIAEFATPQTIVYLSNCNGVQKELNFSNLLPFSFKEF